MKILKDRLHYNKETGDITWAKTIGWGIKEGEKAGWIHKSKSGNRLYVKVNQRSIPAARAAYYLVNNRFPRGRIYHKDGNKLNNSWRNLEERL